MANARMKRAINALFRDVRELRACVEANGFDTRVKKGKHGARGKRRPLAPAQLELPLDPKLSSASDYMTTSEAARYCRFRTQGGLRKAWYAKLVFPSGRRGGRNILIWSKSELDRFLRGEPLGENGMEGKLPPPSAADSVEREQRP